MPAMALFFGKFATASVLLWTGCGHGLGLGLARQWLAASRWAWEDMLASSVIAAKCRVLIWLSI